MLAQTRPYTPALYLPAALARYRAYPRQVTAVIPGVGYDVDHLAWGEQELNLHGNVKPQHYGDYETVPLRGLGQVSPDALRLAMTSRSFLPSPAPSSSGSEVPVPMPEEESALLPPAPVVVPDQGFLAMKVGSVPVWALGLGGLAVAGGGAWWLLRKKKVKANRRRRR
jgi:hypothetical protein